MRAIRLLLIIVTFHATEALSPQVNRRDAVLSTLAGASAIFTSPPQALAAGLAAKLSERDPSVLKNSLFNIPPPAQVYPPFMRGNWQVTNRFNGYMFPSTTLEKSKLLSNPLVPGFQKCSIAALCDIGKEEAVYEMRIDQQSGLEDRVFTLASEVNAFLGYRAVAQVIYDSPNRLSIDFVDYKTRNAERIELFCNARESETVDEDNVFVCSEHIRQVTFGGSADVGVARQVVGNYAHFWTWKQQEDENRLTGNVLTAAYMDPQDPLFFDEPSKPVAIYSHVLTANRLL